MKEQIHFRLQIC